MTMVIYQPKTPTLACVLVRMGALELIHESSFDGQSFFPSRCNKQKALNIHQYSTPYACPINATLASGL